MKKIAIATIMTVFLLFMSLGIAPAAVTADTSGSISGHVLKQSNSSAIASAMIMIGPFSGGPPIGTTLTDANGYYQYTGLPAGQYTVSAFAGGFAREWYNDVHTLQQSAAVTVTPPTDTGGIDFYLSPGGALSGHVYQPDGTTGIEGAQVGVFNADGQFCGGSTTIAGGSYITSGMLAGNYKVQVQATGYTTEWYDNVANDTDATSVAVSVPGVTSGIDFTLASDVTGSISGYVYEADGTTPINEATVSAFDFSQRPLAAPPAAQATTDASRTVPGSRR
jgi:hypothetical protein